MAQQHTIASCLDSIKQRAWEDDDFRDRLLADPNGAFAEEFGADVPPGFTVEVHEDTPNTAHLVLPPAGRLTEADLAGVVGGETGNSTGGGSPYGEPVWASGR